MPILEIDRYVDGKYSPLAKGDGTPSRKQDFDVAWTSGGAIKKGNVYGIKQGSRGLLGTANCLKGAEGRGEIAEFGPLMEHGARMGSESTSLATVQQLRKILLASQKSVEIDIDTQDLTDLKRAGYRLCFAKKVAEGEYNVVWQSYDKYLSINQFSWTPQYQLFGSNIFRGNVKVSVQTNVVDIGLGEESTLDQYGVLSSASTGGPTTGITLNNDYGSIHPGVNQLSTGIDGEQISTPIYVAAAPIVQGEATLTPVEKVLVWFEQNVETSTMFSDARSRSVEIDLTTTNTATRLYKGGVWTTP